MSPFCVHFEEHYAGCPVHKRKSKAALFPTLCSLGPCSPKQLSHSTQEWRTMMEGVVPGGKEQGELNQRRAEHGTLKTVGLGQGNWQPVESVIGPWWWWHHTKGPVTLWCHKDGSSLPLEGSLVMSPPIGSRLTGWGFVRNFFIFLEIPVVLIHYSELGLNKRELMGFAVQTTCSILYSW